MLVPAATCRRLVGGSSLLGALLLLITGETVLKGKLAPVPFLVFWIACLSLTVVAIITAFLDVRAVRRSARREQIELFEQTLRGISTDTPHGLDEATKRDQPDTSSVKE